MARITIEDCCDYVTNRFDLVLIAAQRGKELNHGAPALVKNKKDKEAIIALREIAAGKIKNIKNLEKSIVNQTFTKDQEKFDIENHKLASDVNAEVLAEIESMKKPVAQVNEQLFKDEEVIEE